MRAHLFIFVCLCLTTYGLAQNITSNSTTAVGNESNSTGPLTKEQITTIVLAILFAASEILSLPFMKRYVDSNGLLHCIYNLITLILKFAQKQNTTAATLAKPTI